MRSVWRILLVLVGALAIAGWVWSLAATPMVFGGTSKGGCTVVLLGGGVAAHLSSEALAGYTVYAEVRSRELGRVIDQQEFEGWFAGFAYGKGRTWFNVRIPLWAVLVGVGAVWWWVARRCKRRAVGKGFEVRGMDQSRGDAGSVAGRVDGGGAEAGSS